VHDECWFRRTIPPSRFAWRATAHEIQSPFERLEYDARASRVKYRSDKTEGPRAGSETLDLLEFLSRLVTHIPDKHQVLTRYHGWYANRSRTTDPPLAMVAKELGIAYE
jgi:hypothetical protein